MKFLTKQMQHQIQIGNIKGNRLARTALPLSHILYADDLMVARCATEQEVWAFQRVFQVFAKNSGLEINPENSTTWFSKGCSEECKERLRLEIGAREADQTEKYLGVLVTQGQQQIDLIHNLLIEKFNSKLAGWKVHMLSFAGRLTLIKSMLISIPVYFMTIAKLPNRTLDQLNSMMRRFLWGKIENDRYMTFIAWHKICAEYEEGGLGVRDLKLFNQSLLIKIVWQLALQQDRLWVKVVRAKYCSREGLWGVSNRSNASPLWRLIQDLKPFFEDSTLWSIGDGTRIKALNELWHEE